MTSTAVEELAAPVGGAFSIVLEVSIDGGGGCRLEVRRSESNRELRLPKEADL